GERPDPRVRSPSTNERRAAGEGAHMSRNWKGFASIGAGMAALTLAAPALAAPADLDFDVDLGGHSWYVSNDDGLDDGTPPECDGSAGLAINDAETPAESDAFDVAYLL